MIYEVSFVKEYDYVEQEPVFESKLFKNRDKAFKFMVQKQNFAPCMYLYNSKNYKLTLKEIEK